MHVFEQADADGLYREITAAILKYGTRVEGVSDPLSIGSGFGGKGRATIELAPVELILRNPRARWIWNRGRRMSIANAVGQWFWLLAATDDLEMIEFYNPLASKFSDDARTVYGTWGQRLFGEQALFQKAIDILKRDPPSRRAVIPLLYPDDLLRSTKNYPCLLSFQLLIRDGKLQSIVTMRSNDALMVLPYDLFVLTMVHELAAVSLNLEPGPYIHIVGSMHVYEKDLGLARRVTQADDDGPPMDAMPTGTDSVVLRDVLRLERQLRRSAGISEALKATGSLPPYWADLLLVTFGRRRVVEGDQQDAARITDMVGEPLRSMIKGGHL